MRCKNAVSTARKSQASTLAACARRNPRHEDRVRFGAGWNPCEQHLAHRRCRDADPDALQLADDPLVPPVAVLAGETQDQVAERALERRSPCPPMRVRPAARDKLAVPAQQLSGLTANFDREVRPRRSRYCATERGEQRSVSPGQPRPSRLTPKNRKLVTQEQDLELLRTTRPCQQPHQREQIPHHEIDERPEQAAPSSTDGKSPEPNEPDAHPEPRTSLRTLRPAAPGSQ
jgi:hypothetical protein